MLAACVILDLDGLPISGLNDSKQLSPAARERLFPIIRARALAWSIGEAVPEEIDRLNILQATFLAMRRALEESGDYHVLIVNNKAAAVVRADEENCRKTFADGEK